MIKLLREFINQTGFAVCTSWCTVSKHLQKKFVRVVMLSHCRDIALPACSFSGILSHPVGHTTQAPPSDHGRSRSEQQCWDDLFINADVQVQSSLMAWQIINKQSGKAN